MGRRPVLGSAAAVLDGIRTPARRNAVDWQESADWRAEGQSTRDSAEEGAGPDDNDEEREDGARRRPLDDDETLLGRPSSQRQQVVTAGNWVHDVPVPATSTLLTAGNWVHDVPVPATSTLLLLQAVVANGKAPVAEPLAVSESDEQLVGELVNWWESVISDVVLRSSGDANDCRLLPRVAAPEQRASDVGRKHVLPPADVGNRGEPQFSLPQRVPF